MAEDRQMRVPPLFILYLCRGTLQKHNCGLLQDFFNQLCEWVKASVNTDNFPADFIKNYLKLLLMAFLFDYGLFYPMSK